ncbi:hypothetical protein HID58_040084 [Brassica napus]|uniref:Uncharacterized protein n=1 Tax=Brassica napus TaxID=3708 RepID=A0ABQ8B710_BRANA|nr:hypothetical protein HID58_040084 [Brassica napus]
MATSSSLIIPSPRWKQEASSKHMEEAQTLTFTLIFVVLTLIFFIVTNRTKKRKPKLPPSPPFALPVIGHLRLLKPPLHRVFYSISQSLGGAPIFSLRLGSRLVFVVSSHSIAEECFTKNDVVLANRPNTIASKYVSYDHTTMVTAPYGEHWRNLRRIGAVEIFSAHRLNKFLSIRQDEVRRLIVRLSRNSSYEFAKVEINSMFSDLTFNNIIRMVAGKRYYGDVSEENSEAKLVRQLIADLMSIFGAGNAADYVPILRWVTGFEKRVKELGGRFDEFLQGLVDERRAAKEKGNTMIDHLLSLQETQPGSKRKLNLPPSPAISLPLIGHLHLLKPPLHRSFRSLSKSIGNAPIFQLRLGNRLVYVISSRSMAEECFTGNDVVLANRPKFIVSKYVGYNATHLIAASYGDHWRNLRRIAAVELFSTQRLNAFLYIRKDEIQRLISRLSRDSLHGFVQVEMKSLLANLASNNIIRMAAGKRYYGEENDEAKFVRQLVSEVVTSAGAGNPADYLSIVRWFTNYEKRIKNLGNRFDAFLQRIVDKKRADKEKGETMIDRLLSLQETQPDYYTDDIIKGLILTLTIGGTDTSAVTLEWALSNLLNHPEVLKKARAEIDDKIGFGRLVDEPDIVNLPYLQNIVSETLRLYPAVPLLLPHVSSDDCKVAGYDVPRGTMVLTNVWAMHRDPMLWEDPELFKPERFEKEGEAEKLLPFGMGRRACPGAGLAQRLVSLVLATLVQCFEWERVGEELVDMTEDKGVTLPKLVPLRTMCKSRPIACTGAGLSHQLAGLALVSLVQFSNGYWCRTNRYEGRKGKESRCLKRFHCEPCAKPVRVEKWLLLRLYRSNKNLPPSPRVCFPIIGHLHLLKQPLLHRTLLRLSHSLGPVFSLRLGSRLAVIVSSPAAAEECFLTKNDIVLANRPRFTMGKYVAYDYTSMVTAPYGDHWRNLRRITALEVFSTHRLNGSAEIRQDEVKRLLQKLYGLSVQRPAKVELRTLLTGLTLNVIMRMMTGKRFCEEDEGGKEKISLEFQELVAEILELSSAGNPADFLPALQWYDYKDYIKRAKKVGEKMDSLLQGFLDEHRANKGRLEFTNTMIAHLLDSQEKEPHYYNDVTIKGLILMMVIGGTDTSALTVEWAMSNLLNHPQVLETTRQNIDTHIVPSSSSNRRLLKEDDLVNMNYLNCVVSETLRLCPVAPLMVPHFSSSDCVIGGFDVPRDTIVLVNLWAIHRDPRVWDDPTSFKPERFEDRDQLGQYNGKMMPFGLGRRVCPGLGLANRVVGLVLGSMIQCFEWESGSGGPVDMTEGPGLSMPKAEPLVVTCRPREVASELLLRIQ